MATIRKRGARFNVQVRLKGYPSRTASFPTRRLAERWAATTEAAMIEGRHFRSAAGRRRTVADAIAKFRETHLPAYSEQVTAGGQLTWWEREIGGVLLDEVSDELIEEKLRKLAREPYYRTSEPGAKAYKRSARTVQKYAKMLARLFKVARKSYKWTHNDPFATVQTAEAVSKTRFVLTDDERAKLFAETAKDTTPDGMMLDCVAHVAVACTARTGELKRLLWRHVDLVGERVDGVEMGRLEFWRTKNGEPRAAWVSGQALEKLRALKSRADARGYGGPDDPVFLSNRFAASGKIFRFLRPLQRACRRAGVPVITFHTTRHISGTLLARSGATHEELKAIGGWKSDVVKVYVHMAAQDIKDRVAKMHREKLDS